MSRLGLWIVENERPARLPDHSAFLEKHLETWVENDASLVLEGLKWVGRQITLPDRSRLDLLGITPQGEWVVAELKAGPVNTATLNQALGYAMLLGSMDSEDLVGLLRPDTRAETAQYAVADATSPRPMALLLVGTSQAPDLERSIRFLQERGLNLPIRIATFSLFKQTNGTVLLARDVEDKDQSDGAKAGSGIERVLKLAADHGVGEELTRAVQIAGELGLRTKAWPWSLTINSPANWRKTLLYLAPSEAAAKVGYSAENFAEAFGVTEADVEKALGPNWAVLSKAELPTWLQRAREFTQNARERAEARSATP